jgi:hypothetical protein
MVGAFGGLPTVIDKIKNFAETRFGKLPSWLNYLLTVTVCVIVAMAGLMVEGRLSPDTVSMTPQGILPALLSILLAATTGYLNAKGKAVTSA